MQTFPKWVLQCEKNCAQKNLKLFSICRNGFLEIEKMCYGFTTPSTYSSVLVILQPHPRRNIFFILFKKNP